MHWRQTRPLAACHPFERQSAIRTLGVDIARVIETATQQLGPIDILVHNAGGDIAAKGGKPESEYAVGIREEDVRAVLDRNLLSTNPDLPGGGKGDDAAATGPHLHHGLVAAFKGRTNGSIYAVAKAGMTHYARCLATRTGRFIGTPAVDQDRMVETCTIDRIATVEESPPQPGICSIFEYVLSP